MTEQHQQVPAISRTGKPTGGIPVRLPSRGGMIVYAKNRTQARILESTERIIANAKKASA